MPAEPVGTLTVMPALTEGQVDSLMQRLELYAESIGLTLDQWAKVLYALFPEYFGGDEQRTYQRAKRVRDGGGDRPRPNGYRRPDPIRDAEDLARRNRTEGV